MAAELDLVRCQSCGAGLGVTPGMKRVSCGYCRAVSPVVGLGRHVAMPVRVTAAESEGLEALREALTKKYAPGPIAWVAVFTLGVLALGMGVGVFVQLGLALNLPKNVGVVMMLGLTVLGIILFVVFVFWFGMRRDPRIDSSLRQVHEAVEREPAKGQCPGCGAALQVPALSAALTCLFCRAPLLASEGMLVRWVENAEQRKQAWSSQAAELLRRVRLSHGVQGCLSPVAYVAFVFVGCFALFIVIKVVRVLLGLE